jgi:Domain of unknown function (DUF6249)
MDPRFLSFSLVVVALFSFLSVMVWSRERRLEREAYYRSDALKKIAEAHGTGSSVVLEVLREEEKIAWRGRRETQKVSGLVTIAAGLGMTIFLSVVDRRDPDPAYVVGVIPVLVGVALLVYAYVLAPKE